MASNRIYLVIEEGNDKRRLVRANTPAQAIGHVVRGMFKASVASQDSLIATLGTGATVEDAGEQAGE